MSEHQLGDGQLGDFMLFGDPHVPTEFEVDATSGLGLDHAVGVNTRLNVNASSILAMTELADAGGAIRKAATSALVFNQTVHINIRMVTASSTLALTQIARPKTFDVFATSALALTQAAVSKVKYLSATSALVFSQTAITRGPLYRSASNDVGHFGPDGFGLDQTAYQGIKRALADNLIIFDEFARSGVAFVSAESTLTLSHSVRTPIPRDAESTLGLSDFADCNIKFVSAESTLTLVSEVDYAQFITSELSLTQEASGVKSKYYRVGQTSILGYNEEIADPDTFLFDSVNVLLVGAASAIVERAARLASSNIPIVTFANGYVLKADAIGASAESILTLSSEARVSIPVSAESNLSLSQEATVDNGLPALSMIPLDHEVTVTLVRGESASSTLTLDHSLRYIIRRGCQPKVFSPFIGSGPGPTVPSELPIAADVDGFRLQFPAEGAVIDELLLRNPSFGNTDRLAMNRINRETRGGTLIIFADPIWAKTETMILSFSALTQTKARALQQFILDHLGQEIRLIDWENRAWRGVIISPQDQVVQDHRDSFTATFEFEGTRDV